MPEQALHVLRAVLRVAARAAVAGADVEEAVRAEREPAAVVVAVRLVDRRGGRARSRVPRASRSSCTGRPACRRSRRRVVDVDEAIRRVLRDRTRDREDPALRRTRRDPYVEEDAVRSLPRSRRGSVPALLDDVEPVPARSRARSAAPARRSPRATTTFRNALSAPEAPSPRDGCESDDAEHRGCDATRSASRHGSRRC